MYLQFDNNGLISNGINLYWTNSNSSMDLYPNGFYFYEQAYRLNWNWNNFNTGDQLDYAVVTQNTTANLYSTYSKSSHITIYDDYYTYNYNTYIIYGYTDNYEAGWRLFPKSDRGDTFDYIAYGLTVDKLLYDYNNAYYADANNVASGTFNYYSSIDLTQSKYLTISKFALQPVLYLIGDKTEKDIVVPEGNDSILRYKLGKVVNNNFVEKTLQVNAPVSYTSGGTVVGRT